MTLAGKKICVAFPDTILEEHDSLREKTSKLGQIARSCSIFGVDLIRVFHDPRGRGESSLIRKILEYLETPQYLRRRLFPLSDDLKFAGLLPPIRIPSHKSKIPIEKLHLGEYREGVIVSDGLMVDVGLDAPIHLKHRGTPNQRVTVKIASKAPFEGITVGKQETGQYWGYDVDVCGISNMLADRAFPSKIATSRLGDPLSSVIRNLERSFHNTGGTMLIFGSPSRGLFELLGKDIRSKSNLLVVNLFPGQNVATVRSEEAIMCALYLLETLSCMPS